MTGIRSLKQFTQKMLFTGFFTGYSPCAPGTAASLLAAILYVVEYKIFGRYVWISNLIIVLVLLYPSVKIADAGEKYFNTKDPGAVVIDEIIGTWTALLFFPFNWITVIAAFVLFRIMDIIKPFPIRRSEKFPGGFGILIDDVISGVYANIVLHIIYFIFIAAGIDILK